MGPSPCCVDAIGGERNLKLVIRQQRYIGSFSQVSCMDLAFGFICP